MLTYKVQAIVVKSCHARPLTKRPIEANLFFLSLLGSKNRPETVSVPMKVVADSKGQEVAIMTTDTSVYTGTIEEYDEVPRSSFVLAASSLGHLAVGSVINVLQ